VHSRIQVAGRTPACLAGQTRVEFQCTPPRIQVSTGLLHPLTNQPEFQCTPAFRCTGLPTTPIDQLPEFQCTHSRIQVSRTPHPYRPTAQSFSARTPAFRWLGLYHPTDQLREFQCILLHSGARTPTTPTDQLPEFQCTHSRIQVFRTPTTLVDQLREFQCTHSRIQVWDSYHPNHCQSFSARILAAGSLPTTLIRANRNALFFFYSAFR
jgi:hypothetical protein